ncbi:hypothetical protein FGO68_gene10631 [Halteria grandinella]|uniref:Uncharacterized protein n=1 Tax=Halteria grandinella TaxID=5974 RepID=A0A8J8NGI4_HALGN|nr:hypothetical protein FGO68_gene10631 [Halteria grandinella]
MILMRARALLLTVVIYVGIFKARCIYVSLELKSEDSPSYLTLFIPLALQIYFLLIFLSVVLSSRVAQHLLEFTHGLLIDSLL